MAAPLVVAGVAMAVGAAVNYYNAEKARGADKKKLKEIRDLFERIKPPGYDLSIDAAPQLHMERIQLPQFSDPMQAPKFDDTKLRPEDIKLVGKYIPQIMPYVAEEAPKLIEQSGEMKKGREAQMSALQKFMQMGETGYDDVQRAAVEQASRRARTDSQARQQAIMQDAQRRGVGGSGMNLIAQLQGTASDADRQAMANLEAAKNAQQARMQALSQGAQLGGQVRGEDISLQARNADAINSFNQRMANTRRDYEASRAGTLNEAGRFNLGMAQDVERQNVGARNQFSAAAQARADALSKYRGEWDRGERGRTDDIAQWKYGQDLAEQNRQNEAIKYGASWRDREKDQFNRLLSQQFDDQYRQAGAMSGVLGQERAAAQQGVQDRAAAVSGLANAAASGYAGYAAQGQQQQGQQRANLRDDERAYFDKTGEWWNADERAARKKTYDDDYYP